MVKVAVQNLLMVNYEYPPLGGGGGVFTQHLAEEMARELSVTVLTTYAGGLSRDERRSGVRIVRVPVAGRNAQATASLLSLFSFFPASLRRGLRLLDEEPYDLVHSFFAIPSAPSGFLLARRARLPHVLSLLGGDVYDPTKRLSPHRTPGLFHTVKALMNHSDRVVAMSNDIRSRAIGLYGIEREIDIVPHGIATPVFPQGSRSDFGFAEDDVVLITIGRLIRRKNLENLLEVIARIDAQQVKLAIVGDGPLRQSLEETAREAGIGEQVRFLGYVSEEAKWQLLRIADAYVSTALHEGFGIVFLEAMEAGLPIVTYDEGGQADFLADGETAFLVPLGHTETFVESLLRLFRDPLLRRRMGEHGRRAVVDYHIDRSAARFRRIYAEAADRFAAATRR
jgi:glycosyltransferase involved in cell wall biosynthesis